MATQTKKKTMTKNQARPENREAVSATAKITLRPSANAAAVIAEYAAPFGDQDIGALMDALNDSIDKVIDGSMNRCEAMLIAQAHALQAIFMNLSRRAIKQEYLKNYEIYLRLALKAQSQCRATLETLALIKNPPIVFAKQANIAQGHQQINNGTLPADSANTAHAGKTKFEQNELLEAQNEQRLEHRATHTPSCNHQELEAVETSNRTKNYGR